MFVNAGNYGLGVTRLAFGAEAEARAVIYFVSSSILVYTLGTLIASGFKGGWRGVLKHLLKLPQVYALRAVFDHSRAWVASAANRSWKGCALPAQAAIPMMLLLLGVQLADARPSASIGSRRWWARCCVLLVAPARGAWGWQRCLNLSGTGTPGRYSGSQHARRRDHHAHRQ